MPNAKTIQIFCPTGEPRGVRIAAITTSIVQAVVVPRAKLDEAIRRPELGRVGVYFLFGRKEESDRWQVYIGEADDCGERLKTHAKDDKKEFWQLAIAMVSSTQSLTKAHGRLLEHWAARKAREAGRYDVLNGNSPSKPPVPEPMEAESVDVLEVIDTLLGTLGHPVFEALGTNEKTEQPIFFCKASGSDAKGIYSEDGFVILAGSRARGDVVASIRESITRQRETLIADGVLVKDGSGYRFVRDHAFTSPSAAAGMVTGSTVNGWITWLDKNGNTLDEVYREDTES